MDQESLTQIPSETHPCHACGEGIHEGEGRLMLCLCNFPEEVSSVVVHNTPKCGKLHITHNNQAVMRAVDGGGVRVIQGGDKIENTVSKAAYVNSQGQIRNHHCHWPGCDNQVPPAMWGCKTHWFKLPAHLRREIWRTFEPGQEVAGTPSADYLKVAMATQEWIKSQEGERSER